MAPHSKAFGRCITNFFKQHCNRSKKETVKHFAKESVPPETIYKILKRLGKCGTVERKVGSGYKPRAMMPKKVQTLHKMFKMAKNISYHIVAQKYKCSKMLVHYTAKTKLHIADQKQKLALWYKKGQL